MDLIYTNDAVANFTSLGAGVCESLSFLISEIDVCFSRYVLVLVLLLYSACSCYTQQTGDEKTSVMKQRNEKHITKGGVTNGLKGADWIK